jgi:6-phosphofructokinase 1
MKKITKKTICIFTGGGVAPALNATLHGIIKKAEEYGWRVLGGKFGWKSLMSNGEILDLKNLTIGKLENIGGSFLGTSRTNPLRDKNGVKKILAQMKKYKIDYLLPISGDDTLGAAKIL